MSSPCLGPEFSLDDGGRIQVDICGPPNQQDWPYTCSTKQNNGLHRTEGGCLWVTPQTGGGAGLVAIQNTCGAFCSVSTTAAYYNTAVVSLTFINADPCRNRDVFVYTDYMYRFTPTSNASITNMYRQVSGVDGGDAGWTLVHTVDSGNTNYQRVHTGDSWVIKDIPPGASKTIKVGMRVNMGLGTATVQTIEARVGAFGIASN